MNFLISTTMIILLVVLIALLTGIVVYINLQFYQEKRAFGQELASLQKLFQERRMTQFGQRDKVKLTEEFDAKIKTSNERLSNQIFKLNYELFEILTKNNFLRK